MASSIIFGVLEIFLILILIIVNSKSQEKMGFWDQHIAEIANKLTASLDVQKHSTGAFNFAENAGFSQAN